MNEHELPTLADLDALRSWIVNSDSRLGVFIRSMRPLLVEADCKRRIVAAGYEWAHRPYSKAMHDKPIGALGLAPDATRCRPRRLGPGDRLHPPLGGARVTRLLTIAMLLSAVACSLAGCSVGCSLPDCAVTTTDGLTIQGAVFVGPNTVTVSGPEGRLTIAQQKVLRIERGQKPEVPE